MDTQRKARGGPREHRRSNSGTYKVHPFFIFLFYSTNKNLTTLTPPASRTQQTRKTCPNRHIILIILLTYHQHPEPPKTSHRACFQGVMTFPWQPPPKTSWGTHFRWCDLSLATTTTHNPQKCALQLVFGRLTSPWQPSPPTIPKNEHHGSFSGGIPLLGNHHHSQPMRMSTMAHS